MKKLIFLTLIAGLIPIAIQAQNDDLYFTPSKNVDKQTTPRSNERSKVSSDYYSGSLRDVDEYNRRPVHSYYETTSKDSLGNDIIEFHSGLEDEKYITSGSEYDMESEYAYSRRMSRFDDYLWHYPWHGGYYDYYGYSPYWYLRRGGYFRWYGYYGLYDPFFYDWRYPYGYWYYPYWGYHRYYDGWYSSWYGNWYGGGYYPYYGSYYVRYRNDNGIAGRGTGSGGGGHRGSFSGSRRGTSSVNVGHGSRSGRNGSFGTRRPSSYSNDSYNGNSSRNGSLETNNRIDNGSFGFGTSSRGGTRDNNNNGPRGSYNGGSRSGGGSFGGGSRSGGGGGGHFGGRR